VLVKGFGEYATSDELFRIFNKNISSSQAETSEYKQQLTKEMNKFNGKNVNDGTESENTSIQFITTGKNKAMQGSPDRIDQVADEMNNQSINSLEKGLAQLELAEGTDEDRHDKKAKY